MVGPLDVDIAADGGKMLDAVRRQLFGYNHVDVPADETPTLVGVYPFVSRNWNGDAAAVLERFRVSDDKTV